MKRVVLATTSLVFAGGMAAADVAVTGSAEMGVSGAKGEDAKLHRDIRVKFGLSGATDTGLSFGASADFHNAGKYRSGGSEGAVHLTGAFGTLTLGNTDGAFDAALTEVGAGTAIADNHTGHPGYSNKYDDLGGGNAGLDGFTGNGGGILRYDYSLGGITTSASGEFAADDSSNSAVGVGVAWSGDMGGIGIGIGLGYQTGSKTVDGVAHDASVVGASVSVDMGNGLSVVTNASSRDHDMDAAGTADDSMAKVTHTSVGVAYTVGELTIGVNGGRSTTKGTSPSNASGAGFAAVYSLGTGVSFQVGAGAGKDGGEKESSWSAGLAFSF